MTQLAVCTYRDQSLWDEYASSSANAHFYYDYRWKKVLEESFGHACFYLMALDGGKPRGIFPLVFMNSRVAAPCLISLPFLNYGGILADDDEAARLLLEKARDILKNTRAKYIEIRGLVKSNLPLITREHKVTMGIGLLGDIDSQWGKLDTKLRNQIKKSQKSGLVIACGKAELLDEFYRVFSRNMRDLGTPVLGKIFFKNILASFPEESNIFIVKLKDKAVAVAFTFCRNDTIEIPWASSIRNFNKLCPNEFMYWEIIRYAILRGLKQFDLGRCTKDSGTYRFKKQWSPEIRQLYWQYWAVNESYLPTDNPRKSKFRPLIFLWKKTPLFIANRLGPTIAKGIPIF